MSPFTLEKDGETLEMWDSLPYVGSFHETSALPGHPGNTVINGHRDMQGAVFLRLNTVKSGGSIILYVGEVAYPYRVTVKHVVREDGASPEEQEEHKRLIGYFPQERLTLVTCTPITLATHRLYVAAEPRFV